MIKYVLLSQSTTKLNVTTIDGNYRKGNKFKFKIISVAVMPTHFHISSF